MPIDLAALRTQQNAIRDLVTRLANLNSFSYHIPGILSVASELERSFAQLNPDGTDRIALHPSQTLTDKAQLIAHELGPALRFVKRPDAPTRVLLVIHYDTVYPPDHPFQSGVRIDDDHLRGPGVADAKGGIAVMLHALLAFERSENAHKLGWEVILNPDEEIGSPGSAPVLVEAARRNHYALVFEPAPDATHLVTQRKGSGNYAAVFHGRAAHAGREPHKGRNAVLAAARFALDATAAISNIVPDVTINVAKIEGGGPANVVPDLAITRFNVRAATTDQQREVESRLAQLMGTATIFPRRPPESARPLSENGGGPPLHEIPLPRHVRPFATDGITAHLHGHFSSPPWQMNDPSKQLFATLQSLARQHLQLDLHPTISGGASDANKIASAAGIPTLDSLGPVGHSIHSDQETVHVPSLVERAALAALLLEQIASGIPVP
jgi:glutamate carboxypeptidase